MTKFVCFKTGCTKPGKFAPKIFIPGVGLQAVRANSIEMILAMTLCSECMMSMSAQDMLSREGRRIFDKLFETRFKGKQPPDYNRAWKAPVSVNSPEYGKFLKLQAARGE